MRPVIITAGKRPIADADNRKVTVQFFFPPESGGGLTGVETGEIDLISGDTPRIIVRASAQVQVDRLEIEGKPGAGVRAPPKGKPKT